MTNSNTHRKLLIPEVKTCSTTPSPGMAAANLLLLKVICCTGCAGALLSFLKAENPKNGLHQDNV